MPYETLNLFEIIILLSIVLPLIYLYYQRKYLGLPPGPYGLPILGYLPFLDAAAPYQTLTDLSKKYGSIYGFYLGSVYTVVLTDPALVRDALRRDVFSGRAPLYITHGIMGGYGIICSEDALWKDQRKLAIDCLKKIGMVSFGNNREFLEARIINGVKMCFKTLDSESKGDVEVNPLPILHHSLGNVINDIVFGVTYEDDDETWIYLQNLQDEGVKHIGVSGVVNFLPFLRFLPHNSKIIKFLLDGKKETHEIYDDIIENCRKSIEKNKDSKENPKNLCVLELFLKERARRHEENDPSLDFCTDEQLRHLLADLFGAGVDTTLTTLRWLLLYIAKNSEIQKKIRIEFQSVLTEEPTMKDFDNLPYFKACISEAQRIRSVVPLGISHGSTEDTELNGFRIPKDTMVIPLQWALHMNSSVWKNPENFNPNRFLNSDGGYRVPPSFMPFQTGKRMCLGDGLAKMLLFLFSGQLLYNYEISLFPENLDMRGHCGITLTPPEYSLMFKKL